MATAFIGFEYGKIEQRDKSVAEYLRAEHCALADSIKAHTEVLIWMRGCIRDDIRTTAIRKYPKWNKVK
jgi:hypothetical protein